MTASTVHPHHVRTWVPLDRCGDKIDQFVMWVKAGDDEATVWAGARAKWSAVWAWFVEHLYGLVISAVSLTFVGGLVVTLALADNDAWAILVALVGFSAITATIAYHWGGTA